MLEQRRPEIQPAYGVTLTIDGEVITDEAIIHVNGSHATAYSWIPDTSQTFQDEQGKPFTVPREPGNELIAELTDVEEKGSNLHGTDRSTGQPSVWVITPNNRPCRGCG